MNTIDLFSGSAVELGDGISGLLSLDPASVDLVLSDLPSGQTAAPTDVAPDLERLWAAVWRALRPDGCAVLMASCFRFAMDLVASQPKAFRHDIVWEKSAPTGFLNAKRQPLRAHEYVLMFCVGRWTFHPQMTLGHTPITDNGKCAGRRVDQNYGALNSGRSRAGATDRYPRSVLRFASLANNRGTYRRHHQQKPVDLLAWLVRSYTNHGDLVVDPFAGSGSTGAAAMREGRRFRGWDSDPKFGRTL